MVRYAIYASVDGACPSTLMFVNEYKNEADALKDAYDEAVELYESYAGCHGIMSWADCKEELQEELGYEPEHEEVDICYNDVINNMIGYYVKRLEEGEEPEDI